MNCTTTRKGDLSWKSWT